MKILHTLLLATLASTSCVLAAPVRIVSFSSVLTEVAREVGGSHVDVEGAVAPGVDPHEFRPTPQVMEDVSNAQLVLASGNGMERYLDRLRSDAGNAVLLEMGDRLPQLTMEEEHEHGEAAHDADGGTVVDPHWWHSVSNVIKASEIMRETLTEIDPTHAADYAANEKTYVKRLQALNNWVKRRVAELPRDQRKLVTSHDAFQYFAREYGFTVHPIEGITHEQEPSAKEIGELIATIRSEHVKAIFFEDTLNPKVSSELTRETGAAVGGSLCADGLGTGEAATYEGMMKRNVNTIVDGLK